MMLIILGKGLLIGLLISLPVGPAGALSVKRALTEGPRAGFLSGLGSTVADLFYLGLLLAGASAVSLDATQSLWLRALGGIAVFVIGVQILSSKKARPASEPPRRGNAFLSAFVLSAVNPTILISLAMLLGGFGLAEVGRQGDAAALLILGVFAGSVLLWFGLSRSVRLVPERLFVNRLVGAAFVSIGIAVFLLAFSRQ
jgi:putative LysE/RhtB family amino acid efflux pump